tara:strand:+ start:932 stop:1279 length:348 start_codon:yes stop_codon:yes gene_type:complete
VLNIVSQFYDQPQFNKKSPMIHPQLLSILRCPTTQSHLQIADEAMIERVNAAIAVEKIQSQVLETLTRPLDSGLVNADESLLMPVYENIPDMNPDDAIALEQLGQLDEETTEGSE